MFEALEFYSKDNEYFQNNLLVPTVSEKDDMNSTFNMNTSYFEKNFFFNRIHYFLFTVFIYFPLKILNYILGSYTKKAQRKREKTRRMNILAATDNSSLWKSVAKELDEIEGIQDWKEKHVSLSSSNVPAILTVIDLMNELLITKNKSAIKTFLMTYLHRNTYGLLSKEHFIYYTASKDYVHQYNKTMIKLIQLYSRLIQKSTAKDILNTPDITNKTLTMHVNSVNIESNKISKDLSNSTKVLSKFENNTNDQFLSAISRLNRRDHTLENNIIYDSDKTYQIKLKEGINELYRCSKVYGRSCLVLSGGASLGLYHIGAIKVLLEESLIPRIICGSSAGSLIASILCTKYDNELVEIFNSHNYQTLPNVCLAFTESIEDFETNIMTKLNRFKNNGCCMDINILTRAVRRNCGDLTFLEAFKKTRRVLNVSVTADRRDERSLLFNYISTPNILIWSAVTASCCLPGLFEKVELYQKNMNGDTVPYMKGQLWYDGSIDNDYPCKELSQIFHCNYFIVSQVNPHIIPFFKNNSNIFIHKSKSSFFKRLWFALSKECFYWIKKAYKFNLIPFKSYLYDSINIITQDHEGDLNIFPVGSIYNAIPDYINIAANPTTEHIAYVNSISMRRIRPYITLIRVATEIEQALHTELFQLAEKINLNF